MENQEKFSAIEMVGIVAIIIILLFIPYKMTSEHSQDATANSYYHNGR